MSPGPYALNIAEKNSRWHRRPTALEGPEGPGLSRGFAPQPRAKKARRYSSPSLGFLPISPPVSWLAPRLSRWPRFLKVPLEAST